MAAVHIYMTAGDNDRTITFIMSLDNEPYNLSGFTVECHMVPQGRGTVTTTVITDVVIDPDQVNNTGQIVTTFANTDLVQGEYTLEWEATDGAIIITFPGAAANRPILTVRAEHDNP